MAAVQNKTPKPAPPAVEEVKQKFDIFEHLEFLDQNVPMNRKLKAIAERQLNKPTTK